MKLSNEIRCLILNSRDDMDNQEDECVKRLRREVSTRFSVFESLTALEIFCFVSRLKECAAEELYYGTNCSNETMNEIMSFVYWAEHGFYGSEGANND